MLTERLDDACRLLLEAQLDCWFLQDFHGHNPIAVRMLGLDPEHLATRRAAVCVHADGTVLKLVHRIERETLAHLPGEELLYSSYEEYAGGVLTLIGETTRIATEYSPGNRNPYLSYLDGGTLDLLSLPTDDGREREVVASGEIAQALDAVLTAEQVASYEASVAITTAAFEHVTAFVRDRLRAGQPATEREAQQVILKHFAEKQLDPDHPPIVAVGSNSGFPHYATGTGSNTTIDRDRVLLIDLWGKLRQPRAVFSDFTRMFFTGAEVPAAVAGRFETLAAARDAALATLQAACQDGRRLPGRVLDDVARRHLTEAGFGDDFTHRLGHSITTELHGSGAHLDSFEVIEDRRLIPGLLFSVEPGIYRGDFGLRTEVNVRLDDAGQMHVYAGGPVQTALECLG